MGRSYRHQDDLTSSVRSLGDPFDPDVLPGHGCTGEDSRNSPGNLHSREEVIDRAVEIAVTRALFGGNDMSRRVFVKLVGSAAAMSLIAGMFPLDAAKSWAKDSAGPLEKKDLKIGFIPITCASPLIAAEPAGFYEKYGLSGTKVVKAKSWTMIRDWAVSKELDCAHMLSPMPLALTLGADTAPVPFTVPAIENINGQAITLHLKHKAVKSPKEMRGFVFAVPFDYSMHNFLLRYYLAEEGVDPDQDVTIRVLPPPQMVLYLKQERIDGYLSPDPFNQRAVHEGVGFIFKLSKEIWPGHPCCALAVSKSFATEMPNSFKAVFQAVVDATMFAHKQENRKPIAKLIAGPDYLDQPLEVVEQVLTGQYADGLGNTRNEPDRIDFNPFPWQSMAVWILTQMKRWGYLKGEVNYKSIAEQVFLAAECGELMKQQGFEGPAGAYAKYVIMGKEFDPDKAQEYVQGFAMGQK